MLRNGGGGGASSSLGKVLAESRTRHLQVATGGRFKYLILSKIIAFLKTEFLEVREIRPTLQQLLEKVNETEVTDAIKKWLVEDGLEKHPRVRVVVPVSRNNHQDPRYAYEPPLKNCSTQVSLLKLLKKMHENSEGLLRTSVEDSIPIADRFISNLISEDKIIQITRLDKTQVLFYKSPEPVLDKCVCDSRFVDLWRKVDVCNKEMSHIKTYLKNQGLSVFNEAALLHINDQEGEEGSRKRKKNKKTKANKDPKPKRPRRSAIKFKDNAHVQDEMIEFGDELL